MKWKIPTKPKIYEALGTLADGRLLIEEGEIRIYSSSRNKYYTITYSESDNAIMSNDNSSYFTGVLGYPSIAYLMSIGKISYNNTFSEALKGIPWKDLNQQFKNDFEKTVEHIRKDLLLRGINLKELDTEINSIMEQIIRLNLNMLGSRVKPPKGY